MKSKKAFILLNIIVSVFSLAVFVFCFIYLDSVFVRYMIGAGVLTCALMLAIAFPQSIKRFDMLKILVEQCDPPEYIRVLSGLPKHRLDDLLNLSVAYMHQGDYQNAFFLFTEIYSMLQKNISYKKLYEFIYHHNLCYFYLRLNDIAQAQQELAATATFLYDDLNRTDAYTGNLYIFNIKIGVYDGALQFFQNRVQSKNDMITKVISYYYIALIHVGQGNPDAAREAANFVVENGNKTVYVSLVQKLLADIGQ